MLKGFWKLTWVETKVFLREPMGVVGTVGLPVILFIVLGRVLGSGRLDVASAGQAPFNVPILAALVIAVSAVLSLVKIISIYREGGILKRLRATPLSPVTILSAHVAVKLLVTVTQKWRRQRDAAEYKQQPARSLRGETMTWIKTIVYEEAVGALRKLYDRVKGPGNNVDNIMLAHSLRPHTMEGHMALYKYVLHHPGNTVPKWFLEAVGLYTSLLNKCPYCIEHHYQGMMRLLNDDVRSKAIRAALESGDWAAVFTPGEAAALAYVRTLTESPAAVSHADIRSLRDLGWEDGEILEINQVAAYFNYANRTVLGLGINTEGDLLGLSPGDSSDVTNWQHQ